MKRNTDGQGGAGEVSSDVHTATRDSPIAGWIAMHGTPDQQARQVAGVLPIHEAIEAMTDEAFAATSGCERYVHDGTARLQTHLRLHPGHEGAVVTAADLLVSTTPPPTATKDQ